MKLDEKKITYKKPQQNIYIKKKSLSDKSEYSFSINNSKISNYNNNNIEEGKINNNKKQNKNNFISITDFSDNNDDNNFISIIHSSIIEYPDNNLDKIKKVDANNYFNKENNSISSFNDLKLSILNKKHSFNTPFIFSKDGIDLQNPKKIEEEKNYQIKRYRYLKNYKYSFNPKIRRQNSKIIQKWWKKKINPKVEKRKKITKIQSVYRGYITRKHLNDIICISVIYQNFINKLQKVFSNYVRRNYFPKRYYKKKYALEKIFPLKLKIFFRKWKKYKNIMKHKEQKAKNMIKIRNKNRYILLILKAFFHIWKLKCDKIIQNEINYKLLNDKDKKYLAVNKLFHIIENIFIKKSFSNSKTNLKKYLIYLFRNKNAKIILNYYKKYNQMRKIKYYLDKWKNIILKQKEKALKIRILTKEIKNQLKLNDEIILRNKFNNLRSKASIKNINDLKRIKKNFLFPEANHHIINCIRKNIFHLIFKNYIRRINLNKKLTKIILQKIAKYFFNKWKTISKDLKHKENLILFIRKLFKLYSSTENLCLFKHLQKWKKVSFNMTQRQKGFEIIFTTLSKAFAYKKLGEKLYSLFNKRQRNYYEYFFDKYKKMFQSKIKFSYKNQIKNNYKIAKKYHFQFKKNIKSKKPLNGIMKKIKEVKENEIKEKEKKDINVNIRQRKSKYKLIIRPQINKQEKKNIIISVADMNKNFYIERLIPYLIKYLNKLRIRRLKCAFEKIEYIYKNNSFCKLFHSWNNSKLLISKKKLINLFRKYIFKKKLLDYMRKKVIEKLTSYYLVITKKRNALFILVHLTKIFKRINQLKKSMRYVKLWRLYIKILKERAAQLEKIEKSFSQTYEKLSDSIFVDVGEEKSVQTQMMSFVDKVNFGDKIKKHYKHLKSLDSLSSLYNQKQENDNLSISNSNIIFNHNEGDNILLNKFRNDINDINGADNDIKDENTNKIKSSVFKKNI